MIIRTATSAELPALRAVESAAGAPFRDLGMASVADDEPPSLAQFAASLAAGRLLVACEDGPPLAFLMWEPVDGATHIEQVSVAPRSARRGIGRALIDRAERDGGAAALTLTTFLEVPWNAPYYARIGFRLLDEAELTPGLRAIRAQEAALGLDRWPRGCMRREPAN
ncbi:GNAT family N-acetyltransferase [Streptomyces pinistramenti]|uniref:GNAT family N-acetyltransferase n=1 Tax=Streptomyces pinistramenti TaxID=2884812 RepID=UPI001D0819E2|nr:GNAT family N-acetyltransferase [Streptomyces pinistramenti]MCB5908172.1 GNAT family N-acetyltransferase [Streptomyces pinistramenti]